MGGSSNRSTGDGRSFTAKKGASGLWRDARCVADTGSYATEPAGQLVGPQTDGMSRTQGLT